jgi:hypothetical protein
MEQRASEINSKLKCRKQTRKVIQERRKFSNKVGVSIAAGNNVRASKTDLKRQNKLSI